MLQQAEVKQCILHYLTTRNTLILHH